MADDLFGDDEEVALSPEQSPVSPALPPDSDNDDDDSSDAQPLKEIDTSLPRHAFTDYFDAKTYSLKVPKFLNVDARPFDPNDFKAEVEKIEEHIRKSNDSEKLIQAELLSQKLVNANTIRWRYSSGAGQDVIKQSNAHFVEWDDGSISLKIGSELFDFKPAVVTDSWLVKSHDDYDMLQTDAIIGESVNLLPVSTQTKTHQMLTKTVSGQRVKGKILSTITKDDPLAKQRIADEMEKKSLKLKRQMENKRRAQEDREGRSGSPSLHEPSYSRFNRNYAGEDYDEEDDFVAADDDEIEEEEEEEEEEEFDSDEERRRADRLKKVKEDGKEQYKEESNRKRRRIIDSDDDEE
ncbi:hypothetical protein DIURU_000023 [Diutina rugosa]|uniref:Leo1-like protein n=1 Tax=Diutina rugosa TaxID=5481 RepID=A0A642UZU4_DIURU|nr:uncharacterized protein DIURU_000023 [Diutina rugosa]KAA8908710.1 hypothetical protein DIURU_000023 [Diutina rugosa]